MEIKKELTASGAKLNFILIPFVAAAYIGLLEFYDAFWGNYSEGQLGMVAFAIIFILAIILHEALYGFTWMWAGKLRLSDIKYGIIWKALMPYAHSKKPLSKRAYQLGAVTPGIVVGVVPYLLALAIGSSDLAFIGIVMTVSAAGDVWIL
jgi:hypothetical protein